jgi:hypothetical protein
MNRSLLPLAATAAASLVLASTAVAVPVERAERLDVAEGAAAGAGGLALAMYKVTIPRNTVLDWHYHPGSQVAWIVRGRLHFTVVRGTAYQMIPRLGQSPRRVPIRFGQTRVLSAGQGLLEPKGMQHYATTPDGQVVTVVTVLKKPTDPSTVNLGPAADSPVPPRIPAVTG